MSLAMGNWGGMFNPVPCHPIKFGTMLWQSSSTQSLNMFVLYHVSSIHVVCKFPEAYKLCVHCGATMKDDIRLCLPLFMTP